MNDNQETKHIHIDTGHTVVSIDIVANHKRPSQAILIGYCNQCSVRCVNPELDRMRKLFAGALAALAIPVNGTWADQDSLREDILINIDLELGLEEE
jgi:hypothetical protein